MARFRCFRRNYKGMRVDSEIGFANQGNMYQRHYLVTFHNFGYQISLYSYGSYGWGNTLKMYGKTLMAALDSIYEEVFINIL